jgi:lysophospholipase L1-like esterase
MFLKNLFFVLLLSFSFKSCAQEVTPWALNSVDSTVVLENQNDLKNTHSLTPFLNKLLLLKNGSPGKAVVVHLGDSHLQADMMSAVIRTEFQKYYGNAGRGLIFPYQVVRTNAPSDLIFSSKSIWKGNRLAKVDTIPACGVSAFGMESQSNNPEFNFDFRPLNEQKETFDQVDLFLSGKASKVFLEYNDVEKDSVSCSLSANFTSINLKSPASGFKISFPTTDTIQFYGASLEKKNTAGVIYHAIGANGAKYSDYNKTPLFWKQLNLLKADCYVVSMGTNEAQDQNLTAENFISEVKKMVANLKLVSPDACVILTTPPVSYFRKIKPNPKLQVITQAMVDYCSQNNLTCWDLFAISNGMKGTQKWKKTKLLRPDLVHFSKDGYGLQGQLFVNAFAKTWNAFLSKTANK